MQAVLKTNSLDEASIPEHQAQTSQAKGGSQSKS
jgi:hypothetical protein